MQRKALASKEHICACDKLTECLKPRFNKGMPPVISCGRCNAKSTIFGNNDSKKNALSRSSKTYNIQELLKRLFSADLLGGIKSYFIEECVQRRKIPHFRITMIIAQNSGF